jgi:hypothetical protein
MNNETKLEEIIRIIVQNVIKFYFLMRAWLGLEAHA